VCGKIREKEKIDRHNKYHLSFKPRERKGKNQPFPTFSLYLFSPSLSLSLYSLSLSLSVLFKRKKER
jgi:hypothetical protein